MKLKDLIRRQNPEFVRFLRYVDSRFHNITLNPEPLQKGNPEPLNAYNLLLLLFLILCLPSVALCQMTLSVGNGAGVPGSSANEVVIGLNNPDARVKGVQVDILDEGNHLTITGCETTGRASDFECVKNEREDGSARVILVSVTGGVIPEGEGGIVTLQYDLSGNAPLGRCVALDPTKVLVPDEYNSPLEADALPGEFCFTSCTGFGLTANNYKLGPGDRLAVNLCRPDSTRAVYVFLLVPEINFCSPIPVSSGGKVLDLVLPEDIPPWEVFFIGIEGDWNQFDIKVVDIQE